MTSQKATCGSQHPAMFSGETVATSIAPSTALSALILHIPFALALFPGITHPPKSNKKKKNLPPAQCYRPWTKTETKKKKGKEKRNKEEKQKVKLLKKRDKIYCQCPYSLQFLFIKQHGYNQYCLFFFFFLTSIASCEMWHITQEQK